jgi:hypothetical protein
MEGAPEAAYSSSAIGLIGSGSLAANGGVGGRIKGGGGGGRVAAYFKENAFTGKVEAKGGKNQKPGEDGSVVVQQH